ncbi:MAG: hypothetical protein KatS3mg103_0162 [Phycisphaerales bacterium]|nr:MAG: hypothetical protein KatS3mg103_0162 [Phycisphaerales bacterium]
MDQSSNGSPSPQRGIVAVTGASGFVGGHVVRALLEAGWGVRGLTRSNAKAALLRERPGVTAVVGDCADEAALDELVRGSSAVIHLVGILRETGTQRFEDVHVQATRRVLAACRRHGVDRYLHMSALGARDEAPTAYQRTKFQAEQAVRSSGLSWTIFRPSLIHGPDGEFTRMLAEWCRGERAPWVGLPYFRRPEVEQRVPLGGVTYVDPQVQPIVVSDVAGYFVEALDRPQTIGEVFNLVGSQALSWPAMLSLAHEHVPGAKAGLEPLWIPADVAAWQAKVARFVGLGQLLPFDEGMALMGAEDSTASLDRVEAYFERRPMAFSDSFPAYAGKL